MSIKDDLKETKEEIQELKEQSLAMELYQDSAKDKRKFFYMWLITFIAFIGLLGYTTWLLNDIGVETTTQEVSQENTDGTNNFVGNDGDIINGKAENKAN